MTKIKLVCDPIAARKNTAQQIAKILRDNGIGVLSVSEMDDSVDGDIVLTDTLSIQVGPDYVALVENHGDEFIFHPEVESVDELFGALGELGIHTLKKET